MTLDPVERLVAEADIRAVKARYFRHLDAHRWHDLADLFTPDAAILVPAWPAPRERDAAMDFFSEYMSGTESVHHGFMPEISVIDPSHASVTWRMEDRIYRPVPGEPDGYSLAHGFGFYHDEYRRDDGNWRISSLTLARSRQDLIPFVRKNAALTAVSDRGSAGPAE
jgi:hypothetical protein